MGEWVKHAAIQIVLGFELCLFGTLSSSSNSDVSPEIIIAFACFAPAVLLCGLMLSDTLKGHKIAAFITAGLLITSGVFAIIGMSVAAADNVIEAYNGALEYTSAAMAFLGALFLFLHMCCFKQVGDGSPA